MMDIFVQVLKVTNPGGEHEVAYSPERERQFLHDIRASEKFTHLWRWAVPEVIECSIHSLAAIPVAMHVLDQRGVFLSDHGKNIRFLKSLISIIECIHAAGVVHGDISPSNLYVFDGHLMVNDLGSSFSKAEVGRAGWTGWAASGTWPYQDPYLCTSFQQGCTMDLRALLVTALVLVSGNIPPTVLEVTCDCAMFWTANVPKLGQGMVAAAGVCDYWAMGELAAETVAIMAWA